MNRITLQPNVQFLYEEQLARIEMAALGCEYRERDPDDPWRITGEVNGTASVLIERAAYVGTLDGSPTVYSQLVLPRYQGGEFNRTRSVNQYLTHWMYPYRGKYHPQMVRALLNIIGANRGSVVLDPYVGSGTTALEASLLGADCIGVDMSPLCALMTRVKTQSHFVAPEIRRFVENLLNEWGVQPRDPRVTEHEDPRVRDFVQLARMVTFSDSARRKRPEALSFRRNMQAMLESVEAHAAAIARFCIDPGRVRAVLGDARHLSSSGVGPASVDGVVTSPPYSIALDYVKNDEHALTALGVDVTRLRGEMTGVRGRGAQERVAFYERDMQAMFREVARVLKPAAKAVFVVGNATIGGREATTTEQMSEWAEGAGMVRVRELRKIVYGLYSVMQQEKILIFRKRD